MAFGIMYGLFCGGFLSLTPAVSAQLYGSSRLAGLSGLGDLAPRPQSLWTHETAGVESQARKADFVWAVFKTHEEVSVCVSYLGLGFLLVVVASSCSRVPLAPHNSCDLAILRRHQERRAGGGVRRSAGVMRSAGGRGVLSATDVYHRLITGGRRRNLRPVVVICELSS